MMFCPKCGSKIEEDAQFCPKCGTKVERIDTADSNAPGEGAAANVVRKKAPSIVSKKPIVLLIPALVLVAFIAVLVKLFGGSGIGKTTIDLSQYVEIYAEGYDTLGRAYCDFDYESYSRDVSVILEEKGLFEDSVPRETRRKAYSLIDEQFDLSVDKDSHLQNGDAITVTLSAGNGYSELGIALKSDDLTYTVEGLASLKEFDPFDGLKVSFEGISPLCTVTFSGGNPELMYTTDKGEGLELGDKVTINVTYNGGTDFSEFSERTGLVPTQNEMIYEVVDVPRYAASLADIPDDMKNKMDRAARGSIAGLQENEWYNYFEFTGMDFLGYYYRTPKKINLYQESDYKLYLVYKINVITGKDKPFSFYNYYCFDDVVILQDGTCTCHLDNYTTGGEEYEIEAVPGATEDDGRKHAAYLFVANYHGYKTVDAIFNEVIGKYANIYDYESTVQNTPGQSGSGASGLSDTAETNSEPENTPADDTNEQAADETVQAAPVDTPDNSFTFNGHTFAFYDADDYGLDTYDQVEDFCRKQGGYLAVINDEEENTFLFNSLADNYSKTAFFGYTDRETESVWEWSNGQSDYENWTSNSHGYGQQPDNGASYGKDEDYAEFAYERDTNSANDGTWNDAPFKSNTSRFICEWDYEFAS